MPVRSKVEREVHGRSDALFSAQNKDNLNDVNFSINRMHNSTGMSNGDLSAAVAPTLPYFVDKKPEGRTLVVIIDAQQGVKQAEGHPVSDFEVVSRDKLFGVRVHGRGLDDEQLPGHASLDRAVEMTDGSMPHTIGSTMSRGTLVMVVDQISKETSTHPGQYELAAASIIDTRDSYCAKVDVNDVVNSLGVGGVSEVLIAEDNRIHRVVGFDGTPTFASSIIDKEDPIFTMSNPNVASTGMAAVAPDYVNLPAAKLDLSDVNLLDINEVREVEEYAKVSVFENSLDESQRGEIAYAEEEGLKEALKYLNQQNPDLTPAWDADQMSAINAGAESGVDLAKITEQDEWGTRPSGEEMMDRINEAIAAKDDDYEM